MQVTTRPAGESLWKVEITLTNGDERSIVDADRIEVSDGVLIVQMDESRGILCFPLAVIQEWDMR